MKTKKLLIFLLCFVVLVSALAVVVSAKGAEPTESYTEVTNSDKTVTTKYGDIPETYASAETYPFVVFKYKNGKLEASTACNTLKAAANSAKTYNTSNTPDGKSYKGDDYSSTILLRRDYTTKDDSFDNWAQNENKILIDLNGYTLTQGNGEGLFYRVTNKGSSTQGYIFTTEWTVMNGTLAVKNNPILYCNTWDSVYDSSDYSIANKDFTWNFKNVTFEYTEGANETNMLVGYRYLAASTVRDAAPFYFNYTNCTFDLTNSPAEDITLFDANPSYYYYLKININVYGGEVIASDTSMTSLTLATADSRRGSFVKFHADENGEYININVKSDVPVLSSCTVTDENVYGVEATGTANGVTSYKVVEKNKPDDVTCDYGTIPGIYADTASFPFVVFDSNGFVEATTSWYLALRAAHDVNLYGGTNTTVLLRRDYVTSANDATANYLRIHSGTATVDLGGNTLTRRTSYLLDFYYNSSTTDKSLKYIITNGEIVAEKMLIAFSGHSGATKTKTVDLEFNDVDFVLSDKYSSSAAWILTNHSDATCTLVYTANVTFNDCSFDVTNYTKYAAISLNNNNKSGNNYLNSTVNVNGGVIYADDYNSDMFYIDGSDTFTLGTGSDGKYVTLEMINGKIPATPAAADYYTVGEETVYFHASTVGEANTVYTLTACAVVEGTHQCSCGAVMSTCADNTNDHNCDVCGKVLTACVDENKNHECDICGGKSDCIDENLDHACDLCSATTPCEDNNNDHNCDTCGEALTECNDADKNHVCDLCKETISVCADENGDGKCDVCELYKYDLGKYGIFWNATNYSVETYPFFVLRYQNGVYTFDAACKSLYAKQGLVKGGTVQTPAAMHQAIYSVLCGSNKYDLENGVYVPQQEGGSVVTAVIIMRRDYDVKMGSDSVADSEYHHNMAHMQGTTILDLGGYTLREAAGSDKSIFTITAKGWPDSDDGIFTFPSTLDITNGRVEVLNYSAVTVSTTDKIGENEGWTIANSVYTVNFDGVTFGFVSGATTKNLAYTNGSATNLHSNDIAKVNVSYKNCVFDLKTNAITSAITLINNDTTGKDVDCDVVINGCTVIASDMSEVTVYKSSTTNGSSTLVKKGENNKYLTLVMPDGSAAPEVTNTVTIDSGVVCSFVKNTTADGNVTYTLYPSVMVGYKIKTSVTLYSNFVYNIYIPVANFNKATLNGTQVEYEEVMVEGVAYYLVKVELPAGEALSDIALTVTLNSGSTTVDANWTLSVLKYTKSVINGSFDDTTKTLMKDMLVYASAAHTYFENSLSTDKSAEITALLADYSKAEPTGEAKQPAGKTYFTDVTVNLDEVPSFRFTLAEGYTVDSFDFTVGGKTVDAKEENGYVEIVMYAYMMLDDVTYTVKGTDVTESYNLYSYYSYAKSFNNENLTAIVEGLMKYSVSAKNYRDYYVATHCAHNYVDGVCTKCGEDDPDVGTLSINAPASIYSNYAGKDISATFSKDWYNGEVTWSTDNANVFVENGKIYATGTSFGWETPTEVTVTATTADHTATAVVNVSRYRTVSVDVETKVQYYEKNIIKEENKGGIIFLGDSYVDGAQALPPFWRDFYQDWAGEKAFLMGMSSSKIDELEIASERIVYPMNPSEIVIHIGHNDMHSGTITPEDFVARLQALISEYHAKLPEAKIYVLSVDPKKTATENDTKYNNSFVKVPAVNAAMKAFAEANDWVSYIDTTSIFYTKNTAGELTAINTNMYPSSDHSHPTLVAYDLIRLKINEARGKAADNVININNVDNNYNIGKGGKTYNVNGDFVISGRLVMTQFVKSNSHLNFHFGTATGNSRPYRFLLWDNNSDGKFGIGYEILGVYTNENANGKELYDATNGLVLNWTIIVKDGNAYWFVGGKLQAVFENPALTGTFSIDACGMDVVLYDIDFIEKSANTTEYNDYIAPYFSEDDVNIEMYGQNGDINKNGKTFTGANGNALTNDYIIKGKLNIIDFGKSNPHIQFRLGSGYRFILWDSNRDGKFGAGYTENNSNTSDTGDVSLYNANGGLILDWAVVVSEGKAYWYINGKLEKVFDNPNLTTFHIGALQMDAYLYDIELYVKSENAEAFEEQRKAYFTYDFEIKNYDGTASTIASTGPTYKTDVFGNTLSGSNYVIQGSLTINKMNIGTNMHIQFYFCEGYRFLLWDNSPQNGKFGAGYQQNGTHVGESNSNVGEPYDGSSGTLTLDWAVVVKDGKAYWFINGQKVAVVFTEPTTGAFGSINIGATRMEVSVYDVEIYAETGSASEYNRIISQYTFS